MRFSIAPAVLFFLTVAAPVLTAPVPSPVSDTTAILAKRMSAEELAIHAAKLALKDDPATAVPMRIADEVFHEVHRHHHSGPQE
ncbi:hypothetical protein FRC14_000391 [Serendipita sp. 396]|nr:hypothetical protein FRC14_000391 [Serendipita sp. 396]